MFEKSSFSRRVINYWDALTQHRGLVDYNKVNSLKDVWIAVLKIRNTYELTALPFPVTAAFMVT